MYQITMAYAYWKSGKHNETAVFDLFFRRNPFGGEFTVFAGLEEVLLFLENFSYTEDDIRYLKKLMPRTTEPQFFEYLRTVTASNVTVHGMREGTVVFPAVPLLRVEGPLAVCQLLETTFLTLINFARFAVSSFVSPPYSCYFVVDTSFNCAPLCFNSLITTNAARYRIAAGKIEMLEFGLRRAQGPDGGLSASKYSYVGGCDATSNVLAGKLFHIPVKGTHAHAFVMSFMPKETSLMIDGHEGEKRRAMDDLPIRNLRHKETGEEEDFIQLCESYRRDISTSIPHVNESQANDGELAAFIAYALSFPDGFLALIDTYDVSK